MSHDTHSRDNPADDFDLWWGVGPTRNSEKRQPGRLGDMSSGVSPQAGATVIGGSRALGGSGSLNPNQAPLMGSLWSHGGEAYGHRHHVHGHQGDITETIVQQAGSPPQPAPPAPGSSRRPVWLPPPGQHHQSSARSSSGAAGPGSRIGQHHRDPASPQRVAADDAPQVGGGGGGSGGGGTALSSSLLTSSAAMNGASGSASRGGDVECKLEALAAAITASVFGKLDTGVREALATGRPPPHQQQQGQQQEQQSLGASFAPPRAPALDTAGSSAAAAREANQKQIEEAVAAAVAPLHTRLAALEEQVPQLSAAAARGDGASNEGGGDAGRGTRGGSGGAGGGVGMGRAGGGGGAAVSDPLLALSALAQRTGTLEGRHKQVQAKVALLDNAFGPKASDWAQTIKAFLQEREAAAGGAGRGAAAARSAGGGSAGKGAKRTLTVDAPVFCPQSAISGSSKGSSKASAPGGVGEASGPVVVVASTKRVESTPEVVRPARDAAVAGENSAAAGRTAGGGEGENPSGCAACAETRERCSRLEKRVAEAEGALSLVQSKLAAAAAAAAADAIKAWEAEESDRRDAAAAAAAADKAASLDAGRQQKAAASATTGGGGNWASKTSVDKLTAELRQLSKRAKDGEDTVALVDHGLEGVRDEVRHFLGGWPVFLFKGTPRGGRSCCSFLG